MDRYIGKILNDRYKLEEIIGIGGMAVVYKATDLLIDRVVAVKILKDEFMQDEQFKRRFGNESKAIAMLSHPNIVDVYDVFLKEDIQYIVMEYIDGITLKQYIEQKGKLPWKEALYLTNQILVALSHAHERGIIHRDIKPHNIMLLKDGSIKVTDFGIARVARFATETMTDKAIGSVHYISPEQASGGAIDAKSDIYSVGVILYEMITARLPFEAENPVSVAVMQVQANPDKPSKYNSEIPIGLEQITMKAMAKNPELRYKTAKEMHIDLERLKVDPTYTIEVAVPEMDTSSTKIMDTVKINLDDEDIELEDYEEEPKSKKPLLIAIAVAIGVVALVVGIFMAIMNFGGGDKSVTVPDLTGVLFETAISQNPDLSIEKQNEEFSDVVPAGQIIEQDIDAQKKVKKGTKVRVVVSSGTTAVKIPDVVELDIEQAETTLKSRGIKYEIIRENSSDIDKNKVIKIEPEAGKELEKDEELKIYVSLGKKTSKVTVPNFVGMTEAQANSKVNSLGLSRKIVMEYDTKPVGTVIKQSISDQTEVEEGTEITLTISKGPKDEPKPIPKPDPTPVPKPVPVKHKIEFFLPAVDSTGEVTFDIKVFVNNKERYREKISSQDANKFVYTADVNKGDNVVVTINDVVKYNKTA